MEEWLFGAVGGVNVGTGSDQGPGLLVRVAESKAAQGGIIEVMLERAEDLIDRMFDAIRSRDDPGSFNCQGGGGNQCRQDGYHNHRVSHRDLRGRTLGSCT